MMRGARTLAPVLALAAGLLAAQSAGAQFRFGHSRSPSKAVADAAWPAEAARAGIEGEATAVCEVGVKGVLSACRVVSEHPAGQGFGAALLSLAPQWRAKPKGSASCAAYFHESLIGWSWSKIDHQADWAVKPWPGELADYYPPEAEKARTHGAAVVECKVAPSGKPTNCRAVDEHPLGAGFGAAAAAMAMTFEFKPAKANKTPVSSTVAIPINFQPTGAVIWNCG
ncbi:MAG TPA: TonB family protein [Phenylobacterium sp.]